jgi:hypothetical protein
VESTTQTSSLHSVVSVATNPMAWPISDAAPRRRWL